MSDVKVHCYLKFVEKLENKYVDGVLRKMNKNYDKAFKTGPQPVYWNASTFGFDQVRNFREAPPEAQHLILQHATYNSLAVPMILERAGIAYNSLMGLLSNDLSSRLLYATFAGQESAHYQALATFLQDEPFVGDDNLTYSTAKEIIETCRGVSLPLLIQVVYEGWACSFYKMLYNECVDPKLKDVLKLIHWDEVNHHGTGVEMFDEKKLDDVQHKLCVDYMKRIVPALISGAKGQVLQAILTPNEPVTIYDDELRYFDETQQSLTIIRKLLTSAGANTIVEELDAANVFSLDQFKRSA